MHFNQKYQIDIIKYFPIAAPLECVKHTYKYDVDSKEEFVDQITNFVLKSSVDKAKMKNPVEASGLMPKMNYSEEQIRSIANFIHHSEVHNEDWYKAHDMKKDQFVEEEVLSPLDKGWKLAMAINGVLGKDLLVAIKEKGVVEAISFCNIETVPLTDIMASQLNAKIKRVSDKNRNPKNKANEWELNYIQNAHELIAAGEKVKPIVQEIGGKKLSYYPIFSNDMCLKCHGDLNQNIQPEVKTKLITLYPNDLATGYGVNELRGIWVVEL
jgi:hypothetical protein